MARKKTGQKAKKTPRSKDPRWLFVSGELSLSQISTKLKGIRGCGLAQLKHRCSKEGWVAEREEFRRRRDGQAAEILREEEAEKVSERQSAGSFSGPDSRPESGPETSPKPYQNQTAAQPAQPSLGERARIERRRAFDILLAERARELADELRQLDEGRRTAIQGARATINEATEWLVAHRSQLVPTGKTLNEGTQAEVPEVAIRAKKIKFAARQSASRMLAEGIAALKNLQGRGPLEHAILHEAQEREIETRLRILEMRVNGTLPPERVQHQFEQEFDAILRRLEEGLTPSEYERVLGTLERDLDTRAPK